MKSNLSTLTSEIKTLLETVNGSSIRMCKLILVAREKCFSDSALEWIDWAKTEFNFGRRHVFRLARVGQLLRRCEQDGIDICAVCSTNIDKLELLSDLSSPDLKQFLLSHDVANMDREELRAAIKGQQKPEHSKQPDFFSELGLPEPMALCSRWKTGTYSASRLADYTIAFIAGTIMSAEHLSDSESEQLLQEFEHAKIELKNALAKKRN